MMDLRGGTHTFVVKERGIGRRRQGRKKSTMLKWDELVPLFFGTTSSDIIEVYFMLGTVIPYHPCLAMKPNTT